MLQSLISLLPGGRGGAGLLERETESPKPQPKGETLGKWIWLPESGADSNLYIYARKTFELAARPTSAMLRATADSRYVLFVNGRRIGEGPVRGQAGNTYFDTYDIAKALRPNRNVIAFLVHSHGEPTALGSAGRPGLNCRADFEIDGEPLVIETDESWLVLRAPDWRCAGERISPSLGFQETYDFSKRIANWNDVRGRERDWQEAEVIGESGAEPWGELMPRPTPLLRHSRVKPQTVLGVFNSPTEQSIETPMADVPGLIANTELSPLRSGSVEGLESLLTGQAKAEIKTPRGGRGVVMVLDFGREVFGNLEFSFSSGGRGLVDFAYGERMEKERVQPNKYGMRYTDRIAITKGRHTWETFAPRAFRYLQIEFRRCAEPLTIEGVSVTERLYPMEQAGSFECSDRLVNDIWKLGAQTARLCAEDTFIDSPLTRRLCAPDARILSRVAYYAFGDTQLLAQSLRQIAATQSASGMICGCYPDSNSEVVPEFGFSWLFSILDYYAFSNDAELVAGLHPAVRRLMDWFEAHVTPEGLLGELPGAVFIDHGDIERRGTLTALNCLYYQGLQIAGFIAGVAGQTAEAAEFMESAHRLRFAINKLLYDARRGLYAEGRSQAGLSEKFSRQANVLAVLFDIPDHYQKATIVRQLAGTNLPDLTTPHFASHYLEALYATDRHEEALSYIRRKWGATVKAGAATMGEFFDGSDGSAEGSLCYGPAACPTRDLLAEFVGIKPVPGSHRFAITPHVADLTWAKGSVATAHGPLKVDWRASRNSVTINIKVPEGVRVDVYPPGGPDATISLDGKHWPSRFVTLGAGTHMVRATAPRPAKMPALDETLRPSPLPQVEILGDIIHLGRRRGPSELRTRMRRSRSGTRHEPIAKAMEKLVEQEHETPAPAAEQPAETKPRRGSRRGRSRTAPHVEEQAAHVSTPEPVVETAAPEAEQAVHPEEHAPKKRTHRGRRSRSRTAAAPEAGAEHIVSPEPETREPVAPPHAVEGPAPEHEQPPKRRPRRGGRGRGGSRNESHSEEQHAEADIHEQPAPEPAAPAHEEPAAVGSDEQAPKKRARRGSRGGRSRRASRPEDQSGEPAPEAPAAEPAPAPAASETPTEGEPERRRRPTRRGSRGGRSRKRPEQPESGAEGPAEPA